MHLEPSFAMPFCFTRILVGSFHGCEFLKLTGLFIPFYLFCLVENSFFFFFFFSFLLLHKWLVEAPWLGV